MQVTKQLLAKEKNCKNQSAGEINKGNVHTASAVDNFRSCISGFLPKLTRNLHEYTSLIKSV